MYQIFLIQIAFQSSDRVELDFCDFVIEIALNFESRETEKSFPPKRPKIFKFWEIKLLLLLIVNMWKISRFAM